MMAMLPAGMFTQVGSICGICGAFEWVDRSARLDTHELINT